MNDGLIPKIIVFVYHNDDIENYELSLINKDNKDSNLNNKIIKISKNVACYLIDYINGVEYVHHICVKAKKSGNESTNENQYNINSTIMEITLQTYDSRIRKFELDLTNKDIDYKVHETCKALFKFATSKLKTEIRKSENPIMHYLFNIQPNGKVLPPNELLSFAKDFLVWFPSLIEERGNNNYFISEYIYFIFRKFWQSQVFGATALITAMYYKRNKEYREKYISKHVQEKIKKNTFSLPIDLEFSDMEFAENNLDLISENIVVFDDAYLAFLAGYQISLNSKFTDITKEWMEDVEKIELDQFSDIFCKRIIATFKGREYLSNSNGKTTQTSSPDAVIQKYVEFSTIFLKNFKEEDVKKALSFHIDNTYITKELISSLNFHLP